MKKYSALLCTVMFLATRQDGGAEEKIQINRFWGIKCAAAGVAVGMCLFSGCGLQVATQAACCRVSSLPHPLIYVCNLPQRTTIENAI